MSENKNIRSPSLGEGQVTETESRASTVSSASMARLPNPLQPDSFQLKAVYREEFAVTMTEFALILPVLMLFIFAFIDLVRVIAVQGILVHVAEQTLEIASTMPNFDVDIRTTDPNSAQYQRFLLARQRIFQDATKLPVQTLLTDSSTLSTAQLVKFTYEDPSPLGGGSAPAPFSTDVAILRPGEHVKIGDPTSTNYLEHETYPFPGAGVTAPSMERLMRTQPIVVEIRARVKTFTPILGDIVTKGSAQGFRDPIPRGPLPQEPAAVTAADVTPSPTPTVSPTPYPFPEPTPTATPGGCVVDYLSVETAKKLKNVPPDSTKPPGAVTSCPPDSAPRMSG